MPKNILEKPPRWVERFLLPNLDARIRTIVKTEVDRVMELQKTISDIDKRLAVLENNPLFIALHGFTVKRASEVLEFLEKKMEGNPLTPDELRLRRELTVKLDAETISPNEARQLRNILNKELEEAREEKDFLAILAILFLLGLVLAIISR
ncbi:hypothetical protein ES703_21441 [subsurface metagenome]